MASAPVPPTIPVIGTRTFRLPDSVRCPEDIPAQHTLPADPCWEDELAAVEVLELWDTLAGMLLRHALAARAVITRRSWQESAEAVAAAAVELADALEELMQARREL